MLVHQRLCSEVALAKTMTDCWHGLVFFDILEQHQKHNKHFSPGYLRVVIICRHTMNITKSNKHGINASIKTWFGGRDWVSFSAVFLSDLYHASLVTLPIKMMAMPIHGWVYSLVN